jgi:hypothetical protein
MAIMLDDLGNIGDFLGGIGVVVTLIYLAFQVRQNSSQLAQNTKAVQANAYQAVTQNHTSYNEWFVVHRELAELMVRAISDPSSLDEVDRLRLSGLSSAMFRNFENLHEQFRSGLVTEEQWSGWSKLLTGMLTRNPVHHSFWSQGGSSLHTPDFQDYIDRLFSSIHQTHDLDG